jgi:hypothetical protein
MQLALVPAQNNGEAPELVPAQNDDEDEANGEAPQPDRGPPTPIVEEIATAKEGEVRADLEVLEHDPGKRIPISRYNVNDQDRVRRRYIEFYSKDFTTEELGKFPWQLNMYISHVRRDERFKDLKNLCELSVKLVDTEKDEQYHVVYKLLKLVLILPVATASVERVFSTMNYVKNKQRNKMGDEYLNNCLVTFIEREFFSQVKDEDIINLFQQGDRRVIL